MAQETPLTPAERIALVDQDRVRRNGQIAIAITLIAFAMGFLAVYAFFKADTAFLTYMATGILSLVFAGIGAAFAIFGLGRTVGSANTANVEYISQILAEIKKLQPGVLDELPDIEDQDPEDEMDELNSLAEEMPEEVPQTRSDPGVAPASRRIDPNALMFRADKSTRQQMIKTVGGLIVKHIATQESRRTKRKKTIYVYHIEGTNNIVFNRGLTKNFFMKIAYRPQNMQNFYNTFVNPPQTNVEKDWLTRYNYVLV